MPPPRGKGAQQERLGHQHDELAEQRQRPAFTWVNQEIGATFDNSAIGRTININGTAIAHSLAFTGTGYQFNGGALTVTAGGITADESVAINSHRHRRAPQAWTVAAGKTLTVWSIHTVISDLTLNGAGNTMITGSVDGGGAANFEARPAGRIIQNGPGSLTFTAAASCADTIVYNGGTLSLSMTGTNFSGGLDLAAPCCCRSAPAARFPAARWRTARWASAP